MCVTSLTLNVLRYDRFIPVPGWSIENKIPWYRVKSTTDDDYLYQDMNKIVLFQQGDRYISDAVIFEYKKEFTDIYFSYFASSKSQIILPLVNYPGYTAVDQSGKNITITEDGNHMITLPLQKGSGQIHVYYSGLKLFKISDIISLLSTTLFLGYSFFIYNKKRNQNYHG